jgi:hypothetical protein
MDRINALLGLDTGKQSSGIWVYVSDLNPDDDSKLEYPAACSPGAAPGGSENRNCKHFKSLDASPTDQRLFTAGFGNIQWTNRRAGRRGAKDKIRKAMDWEQAKWCGIAFAL